MQNFADVINSWPSVHDLATDLGTTDVQVRTMRARGLVPANYWPSLIAGAMRRGIAGISATSLTFLYAEEKERRRRARLQAKRAALPAASEARP